MQVSRGSVGTDSEMHTAGKSYLDMTSCTCFLFSGYFSHSMYPFHPSFSSEKWGTPPWDRKGRALGSAGDMLVAMPVRVVCTMRVVCDRLAPEKKKKGVWSR